MWQRLVALLHRHEAAGITGFALLSLSLCLLLQPIKGIGRGAYGVVCSARIAGTKEKVAIKKIQHAFDNDTDARRTLREVTLLRQLHHENIVKLVDIMRPIGAGKDFKEVYLVYELMDTDLHQIIRSKQPLSDEHFQYFLYQVRKPQYLPHTAMHLFAFVPCNAI